MTESLYTAVSGAMALERAMDVTANNIANAHTTGFKTDRVLFREVLARSQDGTPNATDRHVAVDAIATDFRQGVVMDTGNPLDLALLEPGFFAIETKDGERYTRAGAFSVSKEGMLVTPEGDAVLGKGGPIDVGSGRRVSIRDNGEVVANGNPIDRLKVVTFKVPDRLERQGANLWSAPIEAELEEQSKLRLRSGAIELGSDPIRTATEMVKISRFYSVFTRAIETINNAERKVANELKA